jgi:hypothetical protein
VVELLMSTAYTFFVLLILVELLTISLRKQWWSTIPPISTKQRKCKLMVNNSTNINKTKKV